MKIRKQILLIVGIVAVFALFNLCMYQLLTCRLSNNFSGATQAQMIDVRSYLPHTEGSDLPELQSSLKLTDNLPVLDGAAALVPVYAAVIDTVYPEGCVTYEGGVFSDDNYYGENFATDSAMQYKNTVRGYQAIVDGTTDILFCAGPSAEQKAYAEEKGVELVYVPIGLEGFVFFVNEKNPVNDLTVEQIRKIYAGEYTNWSEVGGVNRIINPVTRLQGSGSQTAFENFMGDYKIGRKSLLSITGASIGFSFRYYMDGIVENDAVKMLSLNGVYPSAENIQNRSYPIVAQFYAIYRADNENANIPVLVDWLLSEEGQMLIEESGYVRIQPTKIPVEAADDSITEKEIKNGFGGVCEDAYLYNVALTKENQTHSYSFMTKAKAAEAFENGAVSFLNQGKEKVALLAVNKETKDGTCIFDAEANPYLVQAGLVSIKDKMYLFLIQRSAFAQWETYSMDIYYLDGTEMIPVYGEADETNRYAYWQNHKVEVCADGTLVISKRIYEEDEYQKLLHEPNLYSLANTEGFTASYQWEEESRQNVEEFFTKMVWSRVSNEASECQILAKLSKSEAVQSVLSTKDSEAAVVFHEECVGKTVFAAKYLKTNHQAGFQNLILFTMDEKSDEIDSVFVLNGDYSDAYLVKENDNVYISYFSETIETGIPTTNGGVLCLEDGAFVTVWPTEENGSEENPFTGTRATLTSDGAFHISKLKWNKNEDGMIQNYELLPETVVTLQEILSEVALNDAPVQEAPVTMDAEHFGTSEMFLHYLSTTFDSNRDGVLSVQEREAVTSISMVADDFVSDAKIWDEEAELKGFECFPNLESVDLVGVHFQKVTIQNHEKLKQYAVAEGTIAETLIENCKGLERINYGGDGSGSITVRNCEALTSLVVSGGGDAKDRICLENTPKVTVAGDGGIEYGTYVVDAGVKFSLNHLLTDYMFEEKGGSLFCEETTVGELRIEWTKVGDNYICLTEEFPKNYIDEKNFA